ncbi:MAG: hypothetical protein J5449_11905, partial [Oscillospiraceae bacterium]|nr:hypothetical protein [Oscillospiraceae bacterium]
FVYRKSRSEDRPCTNLIELLTFTIREFPQRRGKKTSCAELADEALEMISGGVNTAITEWAGRRVSHSPRWCPNCNHTAEGYPFTAECESGGVRAALYWCHECKKPYPVLV